MSDSGNDLIEVLVMFGIRLAIGVALMVAAYKAHQILLLPFAGALTAILLAKPILELIPAIHTRVRVAVADDADHWLSWGGFTVRAYRDERGRWWFDAVDVYRLLDLTWPPNQEEAELAPTQRGRAVLSEASIHQLLSGSKHPLAMRIKGWFDREMKILHRMGQGGVPPAPSQD
ncbi:hypothetical protein [Andreprevotia chitinilytica]|uniref:hypothetical protein n=1 Tax=Andreprevotia chitinilytica TaxID=396808 RepID=UPI00054F447B|nr:hypothetical protein [Andreprevotia chitinilytica]